MTNKIDEYMKSVMVTGDIIIGPEMKTRAFSSPRVYREIKSVSDRVTFSLYRHIDKDLEIRFHFELNEINSILIPIRRKVINHG